MQQPTSILPFFIDADSAVDKISSEKCIFQKGFTWDVNGNPETSGIGTANPSGEGSNLMALTPMRSNAKVPDVMLPDTGWNRTIGVFESVTTQELYFAVYNSEKRHCIFVIDGNEDKCYKVIEDSELDFSDDQDAFISNHRFLLRATYDKDKRIVEKHLCWTNGKKWQGWINVIACIRSNGFNASLYPYWRLRQPHFDRRELLEWPTRPPMIAPLVRTLLNTNDDRGKTNNIADKAFQFCHLFVNTDGRVTHASPYSLPLIVASTDYLSNPQNLPKKAELTFYAGSSLTEKQMIFVREATVEDGKGSLIAPEWKDWVLYDVINRFKEKPDGDYWLRQNEWSDYSYDPVFNTIKYIFDNSKAGQIIDQQIVNQLYTEMPLRNVALSDLGDAALLSNNEYNYNNFSAEDLAKFDVEVKYKNDDNCNIELREVTLYAYIANPSDSRRLYASQVGYYNGSDTQMRFGGMRPSLAGDTVQINIDESKFYSLDFADKNAFRLYFKGTPYYTDGVWCYVNQDNSIVELDSLLDLNKDNSDKKQFVNRIFENGGYFMCKFKAKVPAGKYIATIGRHNIASSGDYRGKSTYIYGIANSRIKSQSSIETSYLLTSIKPDAIVSFSKEMEIDCTNGSVDVWGNNYDLFYIYCPYQDPGNKGDYRFIEGYLQESAANKIPIEQFPYQPSKQADDYGQITDKNGFYWLAAMGRHTRDVNCKFVVKLNCAYPTSFVIPTSQGGDGWKVNTTSYLTDNNNGVVGDCNRIIQKGNIRSLDGLIPYSNIAISIVDGATTYSKDDGTFELIIHNGQSVLRSSNIYVNAAGNFLITLSNCGQIPLYHFDESQTPCVNCNERIVPLDINIKIQIHDGNKTSVKEGGKYDVGVYGADLAGRLMYVNVIKQLYVPSFVERDNLLAAYFQVLINQLNLTAYPDIKWITPAITKELSARHYFDWVGDKMDYLDSSGNIVTDASVATFCAIYIQSLYDYNVAHNFSVLAKYQFVKGDRLKVYDDGDGNLFDTTTYGNPIDIQVLGTNYNQAAINAGLLLPEANTILDNTKTTTNNSIKLIVRYDARLDKLKNKKGFWIELYSPMQTTDIVPFNEVAGFYPVVNGVVSEFTGFGNTNTPQYNPITSIDVNYWDTYLISRSIQIPAVGSTFFNHPFNSPNVNDSFGANLASGGRLWLKNDNIKQMWFRDDTTKSEDFVKDGLINGLATFMGGKNRKSFRGYDWGGIVATIPQRSVLLFICQNDWFMTTYDFHYTYPNDQGIMVTNLDNGLSQPMQKIGSRYGCNYEHTNTVIIDDDLAYWFDAKNTAYIKCDYRNAIDITQVDDAGTEKGGVQSYINAKTWFINQWNYAKENASKIDVLCGIDAERGNIYFSFRPRRNNSNDLKTFINHRRNWDVKHQETLIYNIQYRGWIGTAPFVPEAYGKLRGDKSTVEMYSFAAGQPYFHNNTENNSFNNFYGIQTIPVIIGVFNKEPDIVKMLQNISIDSNGAGMWLDLIYSNEFNSYSYLPKNLFKKRENQLYGACLRNMNSYPSDQPEDLFRSMLVDAGKRNFGDYFVCRFVGELDNGSDYFQINNLYSLMANSGSNKK